MKRISALFVLVLMICSLMLSSCSFFGQWGKTPKSVMERIDDAMNEVASFRMDGDVSFYVSVGGQAVRIEGQTQKIVVGGEEDLYFLSYEELMIDIASQRTRTATLEAYHDGNYFFDFTLGNQSARFYSPKSQEEFSDYYENAMNSDSFLKGYQSFQHTEGEDGTHTVVLSDYDSERIDRVNALYGFPMEEGGAVVTACKVQIRTNELYQIQEVITDYTFSDTSFFGRQWVNCSDIGTAERDLSRIVPQNYTAVEDASVLPLLLRSLSEEKARETGAFTYTDTRGFATDKGESTQVTETDEVTYGTNEGGYFFDIDAKTDTRDIHISYADGVCRVNGEISEKTKIQSDIEAKALIRGMIDPMTFRPDFVKDVTIVSKKDGLATYSLTLNLKNNEVSSMVSQLLGTVGLGGSRNISASLLVVVEDYRLKETALDISASARYLVSGLYMEIWGGVTLKTRFQNAQ